MSTDLTQATTVLDRRHGEVIALEQAEPERLAAMIDHLAVLKAELASEEALLGGELVSRLDKRQLWTWRVGDPSDGVQFEIKAPSPTAGTTAIDVDVIRAELRQLLAAGEIDAEAARAVLKRSVSIIAYVDVSVDLQALADKLEQLDGIAGVPVYDVAIVTSEQAVDAGVKRLRQAGHGAAVERATVPRPAPARRARVTRKGKR